MKIISKLYKNKSLLVIYKTKNGKLIGEVFSNGIYKRGKCDMRATFEDKDATEHRVKEYFGF